MIQSIIGISSMEKVRSQISAILALELSNQIQLNTDALAAEQAKLEPDQTLIDFYQTNIACIPSIVYSERITRPNENDGGRMINVYFAGNPLDYNVTLTNQLGEAKYFIEAFQEGISIDGRAGDYYAGIKLHRLLGICRSILMDSSYKRLGFLDETVKHRMASDIIIGQPKEGIDNPNNMIMGTMQVTVRCQETNIIQEGLPLLENNTGIKINGEDAYNWEYNATSYTIDTPLDPDLGISEHTKFTEE